MIQKLREILEKQSAIISKQKILILKLNDELRKRNLKSEEVALVLQGVTLGLKNARKGYHFGQISMHRFHAYKFINYRSTLILKQKRFLTFCFFPKCLRLFFKHNPSPVVSHHLMLFHMIKYRRYYIDKSVLFLGYFYRKCGRGFV